MWATGRELAAADRVRRVDHRRRGEIIGPRAERRWGDRLPRRVAERHRQADRRHRRLAAEPELPRQIASGRRGGRDHRLVSLGRRDEPHLDPRGRGDVEKLAQFAADVPVPVRRRRAVGLEVDRVHRMPVSLHIKHAVHHHAAAGVIHRRRAGRARPPHHQGREGVDRAGAVRHRRGPDQKSVAGRLARAGRLGGIGGRGVVAFGLRDRIDQVGNLDPGVHVDAPGRLGEIAEAAVALEDLDFAHDGAFVRVGGVQRPVAMDEEPAAQIEAAVLLQMREAQAHRQFEPGLVEGAAPRRLQIGERRRIAGGVVERVVFVVNVDLHLVIRGGDRAKHAGADLLVPGRTRHEAEGIVRVRPDQRTIVRYQVVDVGLVEQRRLAREIQSRGLIEVVLDVADTGLDPARPIGDGPPRLEVIGMEVGQGAYPARLERVRDRVLPAAVAWGRYGSLPLIVAVNAAGARRPRFPARWERFNGLAERYLGGAAGRKGRGFLSRAGCFAMPRSV